MARTFSTAIATAALAGAALLASPAAAAQTLRLLTWGGYAPDAVVAAFKKETGIDVQVTLSNNEDIISKLRATGGAGFDLAQPSQDRVIGPQREYGIYKPLDLSKIDRSQFAQDLLEASIASTTYNGQPYGVAFTWGTTGLVVDQSRAPGVKGYGDLCLPQYAGKVSMRLKRIALLGMAFANGDDPFAAYGDLPRYTAIATRAAKKLAACKPNVKAYWTGNDDLLAMLRSGEIVAAEAWDQSGFRINARHPNITFVPPSTGAMGWIDTFVLPAKGQADAAAYKWINFVMRPQMAAQIMAATNNLSAAKGAMDLAPPALRKSFQASMTPEAMAKVRWFPPIPSGIEDIEGRLLDEIAAR